MWCAFTNALWVTVILGFLFRPLDVALTEMLCLCVIIVQSTNTTSTSSSSISSTAADQGDVISRIKSLELENQSLHKGGLVIDLDEYLLLTIIYPIYAVTVTQI